MWSGRATYGMRMWIHNLASKWDLIASACHGATSVLKALYKNIQSLTMSLKEEQ